MPPAVCPDSDPEDDDNILVGEEDLSQESTFSWAARQAEKVLANDALTMQATGQQAPDGKNSSGMSDSMGIQEVAANEDPEIRRQIASAQRNLFADSVQASKTGPAMPSSTSPVMERNKRRRATEVASDSVTTPSRSIKRTRTAKTYGSTSSKTIGRPVEDETWNAFRNEDAPVAKTSQSARFSDHSSGVNPSPGILPGTIQQDFINHEPNEMFQDTGDTNAFNESSEQRMVDTVLNGDTLPANEEQTAIGVVNGTASDKQQDSSFPWSASTGTPKPNKPENQPNPPHVANADAPDFSNEAGNAPVETPRDEDLTVSKGDEAQDDEIQASLPEKDEQLGKAPPRSSPIVEVPRLHAPSTTSSKAAQDIPREETAQKKVLGRRRNTVNEKEQKPESDPLNSDDKLVGLPKELYKPRPSRRRATEVLGPIDFSQVPEKTVKKRRKTVNPDLDKVNAEATAEQTQSPQIAASIKEETQPTASDNSVAVEPNSNSTAKEKEAEAEEATLKRRKTPKHPSIEPLSPPPAAKAPEPSPEKEITLSTQKPSPDDRMLMKPPPLPPSSKKKLARSKTTIFEDHVEFRGSPRKSPSLSQQQASRNSVLKEVQNEVIQPKRQARRPVVQDDEDEEDELAKEEIAVEKPQPKKRGRPAKAKEAPEKKAKSVERVLPDSEEEGDDFTNGAEDEDADEEPPTKKKKPGRPSKARAAPEKKAKSAEKVLPDSEDEEDDFMDGAEDEDAEEEGPTTKKKKPGRPAKAKPQAKQKAGDEAAAKTTTAPPPEKVTIPSSDMAALGQSSPSKAALERKDPNRQLDTNHPASPPSKINTPTPQKTVHSPIKSSSATTTKYRVGLNKKHKIPSLLKVIRPPKPPTTR